MRVVFSKDEPVDRSDPGLEALRLVNRKKGAQHMTAGVATFAPGAAVILHTHPCEETVIILEGKAMAGGCLTRFGRKDSFLRHLRLRKGQCITPAYLTSS